MTRRIAMSIVVIGTCAASALASGPPSGFTIDWSTVDGGGGTSTGGGFSLSGTIGQPDVGSASGGSFALDGGFWGGTPPVSTPICPEDLDDNGEVDTNDLLRLLAAWGLCADCPEDLDGDQDVDTDDLLRLLAAWGPCT